MAAACVIKASTGAYAGQRRILCQEFSVDSRWRSYKKCVMHHRVLYLHHPASPGEHEKATSSLDCCLKPKLGCTDFLETAVPRMLRLTSCHTKRLCNHSRLLCHTFKIRATLLIQGHDTLDTACAHRQKKKRELIQSLQ